MVTHTLWFFSDNVSSPATQHNVGPFNVTVNGGILKAYVHGQWSEQSNNAAVGFVIVNDMLWGLQWVAHGAGPENIQTSASDDHWLWRQSMARNTDDGLGWSPGSSVGVIQKTSQMTETYRGQGIRPGGSIDVYLSMISNFGIITLPYYTGGSIDFYFS